MHIRDSRTPRASSAGTIGRSLTTESSPFCATRRARTTTPARSSVSSGVSKKETSRTWAPSGSMPSASMAERWADSGIVSLSSTLSAPCISESISTSASSESLGAVAGMV